MNDRFVEFELRRRLKRDDSKASELRRLQVERWKLGQLPDLEKQLGHKLEPGFSSLTWMDVKKIKLHDRILTLEKELAEK